jgi:hypothetical protein
LEKLLKARCGHYISSKCLTDRPSALLAGIMFWKCPPFTEERLCTIMLPPTTLKKIEHFFIHGVMAETMSITGIRTCMMLHAIKNLQFLFYFILFKFFWVILGEYPVGSCQVSWEKMTFQRIEGPHACPKCLAGSSAPPNTLQISSKVFTTMRIHD